MPATEGLREGLATSEPVVRSLAAEILSRPAYRSWRDGPDAVARLLTSLGQWIAEVWESFLGILPASVREAFAELGSWFGALLSGGGGATPTRQLLGVLVVAGMAAIIVAVGYRWQRARAAGARRAEASPANAASELLRDAERLAEAGHWLEAAHRTQLAVLQCLLGARWLRLDRSEPNRTLRARIARAGLPRELRGELIRLLDELEGHWFRDRVDDRRLYTGWRSAHASLEALGRAPDDVAVGSGRR